MLAGAAPSLALDLLGAEAAFAHAERLAAKHREETRARLEARLPPIMRPAPSIHMRCGDLDQIVRVRLQGARELVELRPALEQSIDRLLAASGLDIPVRCPSAVMEDILPNAAMTGTFARLSFPKKLVIHAGLLTWLKSEEEFAAILAHELGHAFAFPLSSRGGGDLLGNELDADDFALSVLRNAGFNPLALASVLEGLQPLLTGGARADVVRRVAAIRAAPLGATRPKRTPPSIGFQALKDQALALRLR